MATLFKDLLVIFKFVTDSLLGLRKLVVPAKAYSWQTFIYLSLYSWVISYFATTPIKEIIALFGWLFLIAGTAWYTTEDPVRVPGTFMPVGALITGFLVSVFAFGNELNGITPQTIVLWPTISALVTVIPNFFVGTGVGAKPQIPKPEDRQKLIILLGSSMLISCWLQFYFVMDNWLMEYPSVQSDSFKRSTFVVRTEIPPTNPPNGIFILNKLQPLIENEIDARPWSQVEKWLQNANTNLNRLKQQVLREKRLQNHEEKVLWDIQPRISNPNPNKKDEYLLDIVGIWIGPSSNSRGYYFKKSCQVGPIARSANTKKPEESVIVAEIECGRVSKPIVGTPPAQR
ncbi:septal junction protein FraD [Fortiea contorta]|uniref:septal junction protein FraD n=1 Tax=Fortiea contorta TaxID=1892405 RepID=UPI00034B404E|nr:septal junction protein FraD [Fortiea contorta]